MLESTEPNFIIGTETWLKMDIHSSEIFPPRYHTPRRDRPDGDGDVMLGIKIDHIHEEVPTENQLKSVYAKINFQTRLTSS